MADLDWADGIALEIIKPVDIITADVANALRLQYARGRLDVVRRLRERLKREHANGCNVDDCLCCRGAMFVAAHLEAEIRGKAGG